MSFKENLLLITLFSILITSSSFGQSEPERKFIQCVFSNIEKPKQAKEIQDFINTQDGVYMIRANFNSRKFFLIYDTSSTIDVAHVANWMAKFSLDYKCLREGIYGVDKVIDQKTDCE